MLAYLFLALALALRFLSLPVAFTSVAAAMLFFGARRPRREWWIALGAVIAADLALTRLVYGYDLPLDHLVTWAWAGGMLWLGTWLRSNAAALRLAGAALGASVSFFLLSNFAVWLVWEMYPKTLEGLLTAYTLALPFFRTTLAADLFFTAVFFGTAALVEGLEQGWARQSVRD